MRMRAKFVNIQVASARGIADRWANQYRNQNGSWSSAPLCVKGRNSEQVYEALCALGDNPPIDKVAEIIGNQSWSYISCDGCNSYVGRAVAIGEYDPKAYCDVCIKEANAILQPS